MKETGKRTIVIPMKMGIQIRKIKDWIPACAGMTDKKQP